MSEKHWGDTEFGKQVGEGAKEIVKDAASKGMDILFDILKKKTGIGNNTKKKKNK